ncbi:hypothetical protein K502DRAFT_345163 [Neoconidiobolus thromboides FSU 785]|nr:hypothetical protein K502DRAFT_345163 [Neoconidiobolus thromboides FSU 785]
MVNSLQIKKLAETKQRLSDKRTSKINKSNDLKEDNGDGNTITQLNEIVINPDSSLITNEESIIQEQSSNDYNNVRGERSEISGGFNDVLEGLKGDEVLNEDGDLESQPTRKYFNFANYIKPINEKERWLKIKSDGIQYSGAKDIQKVDINELGNILVCLGEINGNNNEINKYRKISGGSRGETKVNESKGICEINEKANNGGYKNTNDNYTGKKLTAKLYGLLGVSEECIENYKKLVSCGSKKKFDSAISAQFCSRSVIRAKRYNEIELFTEDMPTKKVRIAEQDIMERNGFKFDNNVPERNLRYEELLGLEDMSDFKAGKGYFQYLCNNEYQPIAKYYNALKEGKESVELYKDACTKRIEEAIKAHHIFDHLPVPGIDFEPLIFDDDQGLLAEMLAKFMFIEEKNQILGSDFLNKENLDDRHRVYGLYLISAILGKFADAREDVLLGFTLFDQIIFKCPKINNGNVLLFALSCAFTTLKLYEVNLPRLDDILDYTKLKHKYTWDQVIDTEQITLESLDFQTLFESPIEFLARINRLDANNNRVYLLARYLCETCYISRDLAMLPPSKIAASCYAIARRMIKGVDWNAEFHYYSGYSFEELGTNIERILHNALSIGDEHFLYKRNMRISYDTPSFLKENVNECVITNADIIEAAQRYLRLDNQDQAIKAIKKEGLDNTAMTINFPRARPSVFFE